MSDRSMMFSGPMVRALMAGTKTQTRRIITPQPTEAVVTHFQHEGIHKKSGRAVWFSKNGNEPVDAFRAGAHCVKSELKTFAPGDRVWVREALKRGPWPTNLVQYVEGGALVRNQGWRWKRNYLPSMHMPRWASRLTLLIGDVRVQRLHQISKDDAKEEGIRAAPGGWWSGAEGQAGVTPVDAYAILWESLHGAKSWADNPWVVAYRFVVFHGNIDREALSGRWIVSGV